MDKDWTNRRRYLRYKPIKETTALLIVAAESSSGSIVSESYRGCCISFDKTIKLSLKKDQSCQVVIGELYPVEGFVRWIDTDSAGSLNVGIEFDIPHLNKGSL